MDTLPITTELCLVPLVLDKPLALRDHVCNMPRIYLISRASIVKVLADGLLDVIIVALYMLAANTLQNMPKVTFSLEITSASGTSGTKLKKASMSARDGWKEPAIISS